MSLHKWLVLAGGVVLITILYNLPKVVVDNDVAEVDLREAQEEIDNSHSFVFDEEAEFQADRLLNSINTSASNEKSVIFADSLASLYLGYNQIDSTAKYIDLMLVLDDKSPKNIERAGELYFQIFGISLNQEDAKQYALKAGQCFSTVLENKNDPNLKAKLAMTKVTSENPMQGILMMREVLEEYPENETALFNMGLLSMQSGQYEKAVQRFRKLISINSTHEQAAYYLAVCYNNVSDIEKSKEWFQKIKKMSSDPAILQSTDQYLKELKEL
ncbi:MAG: tetratricopeptide repeat protein [Reichenbachiella sp.]